MKKYLFIFIFVFATSIAWNQDTIIEFDRPGLADLPYINPLKTIQFESGYDIEINDTGNISPGISPNLLIRYSPVKFFELRFFTNHQPVSSYYSRKYNEHNLFGFAAGTKIKICKEKGILPELAMVGLVTFPSRIFTEPNSKWLGAELYLLANNRITDWFFINYNLGYLYGNALINHSFHYSSSFNFIVHKYMGLYIEHYAYIHSDAAPDWAVDGGVMFFPHPRLQIDITYTRIFNSTGNLHIAGIGLAYNLNLRSLRKKIK